MLFPYKPMLDISAITINNVAYYYLIVAYYYLIPEMVAGRLCCS